MFKKNKIKMNIFIYINNILISKSFFSTKFNIKNLIFLLVINKVINECSIEEPIYVLNDDKCMAQYCTEEQFKTGQCKIDNEIIKTQWLNNIIWIGDKYFRFVNIVTYSNGDMVIETTSSPGNKKRMFYGLKRDGRVFFAKNNSQYYSIEANEVSIKYESEIFTAKINDNNEKEYIISIGKLEHNTELYDFEEDKIYKISTNDFLGINMEKIGTSFNYILDDNNVSFLGFLSSKTGGYTFNLKLLNFTTKDIENENSIIIKNSTIEDVYGQRISCFITKDKYIICFYLLKSGIKYIPYISAFDKYLTYLKNYRIENTNIDIESLFLKGIHLDGEQGAFIYYNKIIYTNTYTYQYLPEINFIIYDYENDIFEDNLINSKKKISLNTFQVFDSNYLLNDFIKISYHKMCLISTSLEKDILYVTIINLYGENKAIPRYYYLDFFKLFKYKYFLDIKASLYRNFVSYAFSFCRDENCQNEETDEYYSGFLIFSYSNSTDYSLDIEKYLIDYNDIKIDNILIDLNENITIENNLFGFNFSEIRINDINCDNIDFILDGENTLIKNNSTIKENEKIKLNFTNGKYKMNYCRISYVYIISDPDYENIDNYPELKDIYYGGKETKEIYDSQKEVYIGRNTYYDILLENELVTNCKKRNCKLCHKDDINYCITCSSNYTILENGEMKKKICEEEYSEEEEEEVQESNSYSETESEIAKSSNIKEDETSSDISSEASSDAPLDALSEQIEENSLSNIIDKEEKHLDKEEEEKHLDKEEEKNNDDICNKEQIINNLCLDYILTTKEIEDIYNTLKNNLLNNNNQNLIVQTKNVIFQLSTLSQLKKNNNSNISTIDFGECQNILINEYNASNSDDFKIIKLDIKSEDSSFIYVQYELYYNNSKDKINLDKCDKVRITLNIPKILSNETLKLYEYIKESGYDILNYEDSFYNDICSPYTTSSGTDILLNDRQKDIFEKNANQTMCQENCKYKSFNDESNVLACDCSIQKESIQTNITKIDFNNKHFAINFWNTIKNSNFLVLKCYKLAFEMKNFFKNIGRIVMSIIFILFLIFLNIYIFKERKQININVLSVLKTQFNYIKNIDVKEKTELEANNNIDNKNVPPRKINNSNKNLIEDEINKDNKKTLMGSSMINSRNELMNVCEINSPKKIENNINIVIIKKYKHKKKKRKSSKKKTSINSNYNLNLNNVNKNNNDNIKIYKSKTIEVKKDKNEIKKEDSVDLNSKKYNLNDNELNDLEYEEALIIDKRTYCEYYWSLLKKKQLILFTFLPVNDYNLFSLKISLFLLSFSLYFTINGFFFSDETMHKTYISKGKLSFIFQIPQILYSSMISSIINLMLKILSLSEKNILTIKKEKNLDEAIKKSKAVKMNLMIKFIIFFIFGNLLLLFFWYYISCFCAVYINTQIILIKDTIISFILSMVYPFGLSALPGLLRIPSLKTKNKNKKFLYKVSKLLCLI